MKPPSLNQCPTTKRRCWNSISFLSLLWWGAQSIPWLVELRTIAVMLSSPQFIRKFVFKKEIKHFLLRRLMFIQSIYWTLLVVCRFRKNCVFFFSTFFLSLFKEMKNSASHNNKTKTKKQKKMVEGDEFVVHRKAISPFFRRSRHVPKFRHLDGIKKIYTHTKGWNSS